ncbi:MAG: hypothetical protein HN348_10345, partial [Proteobacteria bacterium]|nr:hypothetical protein [Pseudomonadota bacterium]
MPGHDQRSEGGGALLDTGPMADILNTQTGVSGIADLAKVGWAEGMGTGLSIATGVNTFLTHDANQEEGAPAMAERATMGGIDTAWGLLGGPAAVIDAVSGGNFGGL